MAYPKPLSEKTLAKMYLQGEIDEKKRDFLHKLFLASANLYGVVVLRDLWDICREVAGQYGMAHIRRKDIIAFSSIVRREDVPYYVYEINELYSEEKQNDLDREIVLKEIIGTGQGKKWGYYDLVERQGDKPYFIPEDLLAFAEPNPTEAETQLLTFLEGLKVTVREVEMKNGKKIPCEHYGETLGSFSFMNRSERFEYTYYSGENEGRPIKRDEKRLARLMKRTSCSEAEKIVNAFRERCSLGISAPMNSIRNIADELEEVGVVLGKKQLEKLIKLAMEMNNKSHLWCNRGWTPNDLAENYGREEIKEISIGPGIRQFIAEGKMSRKELEEEMRKRGIKIIW